MGKDDNLSFVIFFQLGFLLLFFRILGNNVAISFVQGENLKPNNGHI